MKFENQEDMSRTLVTGVKVDNFCVYSKDGLLVSTDDSLLVVSNW